MTEHQAEETTTITSDITPDSQYDDAVQAIKDSARTLALENGVPFELTDQQALSIHLRGTQLAKEGAFSSSNLSVEEKRRQIDVCYDQRSGRRRSKKRS